MAAVKDIRELRAGRFGMLSKKKNDSQVLKTLLRTQTNWMIAGKFATKKVSGEGEEQLSKRLLFGTEAVIKKLGVRRLK